MIVPEGLTPEQLNPQPQAWPACKRCGVAHVLRRLVSAGHPWVWMKDCTHKDDPTVIATPKGVIG